jgi:hypothetical protein
MTTSVAGGNREKEEPLGGDSVKGRGRESLDERGRVPYVEERGAAASRVAVPADRSAERRQSMKRLVWGAVGALALCGPAAAAGGPFGLGIMAGEPTGISGKLVLDSRNAVDGGVAWSLSGDNDLHLHGDYLFHWYDVFEVEQGRLPLVAGIGGRIRLREHHDDHLGPRFPIGVTYQFETAPFDVFFELVPVLDLIPDTDVDLEAAIGGRFYF